MTSCNFARGHFSLRYDCYRPILSDKGIIKLSGARHLLIDAKKVVPVDLHLGEKFDTLVVTGPNTGGKTVVLKTAIISYSAVSVNESNLIVF